MTAAPTFDAGVRALVADAAWWRLAGLLFERPHGDWWREVAAVARDVDDEDLQAAARLAADAAEGEYLATLGPSGFVSPREAGHDGRRDPGHVLSELTACYAAFAYQPKTEEPADHVAVVAGAVGFLRLKEAFARARGADEDAAVTDLARHRLLDHLAVVAQPLADALGPRGPAYLAAAARALAKRVGPPAAGPGPRVLWMSDADAAPGCGDGS